MAAVGLTVIALWLVELSCNLLEVSYLLIKFANLLCKINLVLTIAIFAIGVASFRIIILFGIGINQRSSNLIIGGWLNIRRVSHRIINHFL